MSKESLEKRKKQYTPPIEVEKTPARDLWETFYEDSAIAMKEAMDLIIHNLATVDIIDSNGLESAIVRKRADNSIVYQTTTPSEVEELKELQL